MTDDGFCCSIDVGIYDRDDENGFVIAVLMNQIIRRIFYKSFLTFD
jgi:hypothetical protein